MREEHVFAVFLFPFHSAMNNRTCPEGEKIHVLKLSVTAIKTSVHRSMLELCPSRSLHAILHLRG